MPTLVSIIERVKTCYPELNFPQNQNGQKIQKKKFSRKKNKKSSTTPKTKKLVTNFTLKAYSDFSLQMTANEIFLEK